MSVGVGEDFPHVDVGFHERGFAHRQGAHGASHTRSRARRRAHPPPGCPRAVARSSGLGGGTLVSRDGVNVETGV